MPLVRRTRATLRSAEFGFFGVVVYTRVHTPRRWGEPLRAGVLVLVTLDWRPLRTNWLIVGTQDSFCVGRDSPDESQVLAPISTIPETRDDHRSSGETPLSVRTVACGCRHSDKDYRLARSSAKSMGQDCNHA